MFSENVQGFHEKCLTSHNHQDELEEGSLQSTASSDDGSQSLQEQSLDMQTDMLERLNTVEQARNMDLFEQLRSWQAEQREQLIRQQQQQLLQLQAEQQAAESRLLVQRQNLWSSSKNIPVSTTVENLPQRSSVKKLQVGLPQAIATSTLALARLRLQESVMVSSSDIATSTPSKGSERLMPNVSQTSTAPAEDQITVNWESDAATYTGTPDAQIENGDLRPMADSVSDTVNQLKLTSDKPNIEASGVVQSLQPLDTDIIHKPGTGMSVSAYDELPVGAGAAQGKSFEERVLEQLEKEQHLSELQQHVHSVAQKSTRSKCFLKKGEGTSRFRTSQRRFPAHKVIADPHNLKQSVQSQTRLQPSIPRSATEVDSVMQHMSRKSCLKKKTVENDDSVPQLDFVADNVACTRTPTTSTPDHKRFLMSADNAASRQSTACPSSHGRDSVGDASYLACMQARAKNEEAEIEELQEFELLEHYIDDNASFTSNVSTISQILARQDVKRPDKPCYVQQNSSTRVKCSSVNEEVADEVYIDEDSIDSNDDDDDDDMNSTLVDDAAIVPATNPSTSSVENVAQPTVLQAIYRKISSMNGKCVVSESQSVGAMHQQLLLSNSNQRSVPQLQPGFVGNMVQQSVAFAAAQPRHESIQVLSQESDRVEPLTQVIDSDTLCNTGAATENVFSDEREWNDSVLSSPVHADSHLHHNLQQNFSSNGAATATSSEEQLSAETGYHTADGQSDSPPTSKLAQKLFPKLKPPKSKVAELKSSSQTGVSSNHAADTTDTVPMVMSVALREKLAQLEVEIQQFRNENAVLATLRKEREQVVDRLKKEMAEFERQKADELQRLEEFKAEEMKKLKKERKVFETYQKAARAGPDRKDREELEMVKSQLSELQDETKRKEQKWIASNQRLRDRVEQLEQENTELRGEIRVLEQRRLQDWKPRKTEPVLAAKNDAKLVETAEAEQNTTTQSAQKPAEKFQKRTERQKHIPNTKSGKPEQTSKSVWSSGESDIKPSSQTKLNLDVSDETLQQRNNVPRPQTISPLAASTNASGDDVRPQSAVRKTAPKSGVVQSMDISDRPYDQVQHPDGKVERICPDGSREILFTNGTRKQISSDGQTIIVSFFNGDIKQILPDGRVVYYYADAQTTHTTYADGLQIFQFANAQVEKHYIDGTKEIQFPDQTIKYLFPDGSAESVFLDGTVVHVESNGNKQITFPNRQKEIHTALFKKREYPDGTMKTVFTDGRQETRYSNGRVRIKDAAGVVVLDQLT